FRRLRFVLFVLDDENIAVRENRLVDRLDLDDVRLQRGSGGSEEPAVLLVDDDDQGEILHRTAGGLDQLVLRGRDGLAAEFPADLAVVLVVAPEVAAPDTGDQGVAEY